MRARRVPMHDRLQAVGKLPPLPPPWLIEKINEMEKKKEKRKEDSREQPSLPPPQPPQRSPPAEKKEGDEGRVDYTI